MKKLLTFVAVSFLATSAMAEDGLSFGGEINAESNLTTEVNKITLTPEMVYGVSGFDLTASTDLAIYNNDIVIRDTLDVLPTIDFTVDYDLNDRTELTLGTSYNLETEKRGDIVVGVSFSF